MTIRFAEAQGTPPRTHCWPTDELGPRQDQPPAEARLHPLARGILLVGFGLAAVSLLRRTVARAR